jgi:hypothetical protein
MKTPLPTTVDKVVAGDAGTSVDNPIDALIIGAGPSGEQVFHPESPKMWFPRLTTSRHGVSPEPAQR